MKRFIILTAFLCAASFLISDDDKGSRTASDVIVKSAEKDMKGFKWKDAVEKLEQALKIYESAEAHAALAECYRKLNKKKEALEHYNWVVENVKPKTYKEKSMVNDAWEKISRLDPVAKKLADAREEYVKNLKKMYRRYKDPRIAEAIAQVGEKVEMKSAGVVTVKVDADKPWQDTGVRLKKGVTYLITAEGEWSPGSKSKYKLLSAEGIETKYLELRAYSLIGQIEKEIFQLGSSTKFEALADGNLYLRMNDRIFDDNSGTLTVTIRRLK